VVELLQKKGFNMQMGPMQLVIILAIVVLLFGARKIPELAKGIGSGIRNFKAEMNKVDEEVAEVKKVADTQEKTETKTQETKKEA
jgi:sec-independent protein translocase protein TatA